MAVVGLLLINGLGIFLVAMQLPGTWLILVVTSLFAWWRYDSADVLMTEISMTTLIILLALAIIGEIIETMAGAAGARRAGGSRTGALLAIVGGVIGAIVGTGVIPVPVVGTVIGACVGGGIGAMSGDLMRGRSIREAGAAGKGAAVGKFWGTIGKVGVSGLMWLIAAFAVMVR